MPAFCAGGGNELAVDVADSTWVARASVWPASSDDSAVYWADVISADSPPRTVLLISLLLAQSACYNTHWPPFGAGPFLCGVFFFFFFSCCLFVFIAIIGMFV